MLHFIQVKRLTVKISAALTRLAMVALVGILSSAEANVSLKNGNFFVGYTDITYSGGFEPKIERVYNSKTAFKGMFGWGWGNEYEVYLTVSADGSVVVHEYGGGAENRFSPVKFLASDLDQAVKNIAAVAQKVGTIASSGQLEAYKKKLRGDASFRNDEWEKFKSQGKIEARKLADGSQLQSNRFSYQYITKVKGGYLRVYESGKLEQFNEEGRLAKVSDKNKNFLDFTYDKSGKLQKIVDNFNRKIFITFSADGLVDKIQGENSKEATFKYKDGELIYSKDVDGNVYVYKYSADSRHNLVEILYSDKTTMQIGYHSKDLFENVKSLKDRNGNLTEYGYVYDKADRGHFTISVTIKAPDHKVVSTNVYDYHHKFKADGEEWTYRLVTTLDGEKTETTYNECCGLPLLIKKQGEESAFEYNSRGQVTKKTTPYEVTVLKYDNKNFKVARVEKYPKVGNTKKVNWSDFQYDDKGNLKFAKNSAGKGVSLFYDNTGRIKSMVDQERRRLDFKYNEQSRPIEIIDPKLGTIKVEYTNSGEVKKIDSASGRKIALQVTSAFQNLLEIVRPAGVSLAF